MKAPFSAAIAAAAAIGAACCLGAAPASAHHSFAMFDIAKTVTVQGTVEKYEWSNPHSWLFISVNGTNYGFEMQSVGELLRQGWVKSSFKPGDQVKVAYHPLLDGTPAGQLTRAWAADGHLLGPTKGGPPPGGPPPGGAPGGPGPG